MDSKALSTSLRSAVSALHKGLRKQSYTTNSFSMTELESIGLLNRNGQLLPSELAALTRVKTQSMSQILNKLETQDLIRRTPSKEDKRKVFISLSPGGKKLVERTAYDRDEWLRMQIENTLTEKEKELLGKAVLLLNKLAEVK